MTEDRRSRKDPFAAVVFDMDGVIFDTEILVIKCWKTVADKYGIPEIEEICMDCLGQNQEVTIQKFKKKYGEDFPYAQYKAEMRDLFFGEFYGSALPIKPGVVSFLKELKERKIPVALATSTREEFAVRELKDAELLPYFTKVVCGDMVSHSKPHPEIFLKACEELKVKPEDTYAIEDSYNGIRAAHAGGLRPIMVPDLIPPTEEMERLAEKICPSMVEVSEYLLHN